MNIHCTSQSTTTAERGARKPTPVYKVCVHNMMTQSLSSSVAVVYTHVMLALSM